MKTTETVAESQATAAVQVTQSEAAAQFLAGSRQYKRGRNERIFGALAIGEAIRHLHRITEHGQFGPALAKLCEQAGLKPRRAHDFGKLADAGYDFAKVANLGLTAACRAAAEQLRIAKGKGARKATPRLTPSEKALEKADAMEREAEELRQRTAEAETRATEAEGRVRHVLEEHKVLEGGPRGVDVLADRDESIRQLKNRVGELEDGNAELLRENRGLRRLLKQLQGKALEQEGATMTPLTEPDDDLPF